MVKWVKNNMYVNRFFGLTLCLAFLLLLAGCGKTPREAMTEEAMRLGTTVRSFNFESVQGEYGEAISEEIYQQLRDLFSGDDYSSMEPCVLRTLNDGTRILIVFQPRNLNWTEFEIKDVIILD